MCPNCCMLGSGLTSFAATLQFPQGRGDGMTRNQDTELAFETSIFDTLKLAARIMLYDPRFAMRALRLLSRQRNAAKVRRIHKARDIHVPPFSIFSITGECNLSCAGCYAHLLHRSNRPELTNERISRLLSEARDLGVSIMLIAGGGRSMGPAGAIVGFIGSAMIVLPVSMVMGFAPWAFGALAIAAILAFAIFKIARENLG